MSDVDVSQSGESSVVRPQNQTEELALQGAELSGTQQTALLALSEGQGVAAAARSAGVSRATVWRWLKENRAFADAYDAWKQQTREMAQARLLRAIEDAVNAVAQAAANGDARIALAMLRGMGLLQLPKPDANEAL